MGCYLPVFWRRYSPLQGSNTPSLRKLRATPLSSILDPQNCNQKNDRFFDEKYTFSTLVRYHGTKICGLRRIFAMFTPIR